MRLSVLLVQTAALLVFTGSGPAPRAVADELATCSRANGDEAIAACTRIILNHGASPKVRSAAYVTRGNAYYAEGGDERALADYNAAIARDPKNMSAFFSRGLANFYRGALLEALADLTEAGTLDPKYAYAALWIDIAGQRNDIPSRLSQAMSTIDMRAWPAPIIRMYLGQTTPAAVLVAADDADPNKKKGQVCEVNFYGGELALRTGVKNEATRLFQLAASDCPQNFVEWRAADAELKALGVAQ